MARTCRKRKAKAKVVVKATEAKSQKGPEKVQQIELSKRKIVKPT